MYPEISWICVACFAVWRLTATADVERPLSPEEKGKNFASTKIAVPQIEVAKPSEFEWEVKKPRQISTRRWVRWQVTVVFPRVASS